MKKFYVHSIAKAITHEFMYLPKRFTNENFDDSMSLIRKSPLATLISVTGHEPFVSHVPLVAERSGEDLRLIGHMARGNPHWKMLDGQSVYAIFHGPNAYMTPSWYAENDVPTWNYAVVHVHGTSHLISDLDGIQNCLKTLSSFAESGFAKPWEFWIPPDLAGEGVIEKSIVGFEIQVTSIKAKFKLNQSRSKKDLDGCVDGLLQQNSDNAREMSQLMAVAWKSYNEK